MSQASPKGVIPSTFTPITNRALSNLHADMAAVAALAQGAINVENFTLALYLSAMSSIKGTHEVNSPNNSIYQGRVWPGMSTTAGTDLTPSQQAYNAVFSVFIQEMMHLQLAANLATVLGVKPKFFFGSVLENKDGGWGCYGPENTTIPHIIDLQDTNNYAAVKVNLGELNAAQVDLFLAIEQSHPQARADIKPEKMDKYFPEVPFANWTASSTEADLPMFGTIGWMYHSLTKYLAIEYTDGQNLWEKMFGGYEATLLQRDLFNSASGQHQPEYPLMPGKITASDPAMALLQAIDIIIGIVDQGEGGIENALEDFRMHIQNKILPTLSDAMPKTVDETDPNVKLQYQPDPAALEADYPSYDSSGNQLPASADAAARHTGDKTDHWARFHSLKDVIKEPGFMTFAQWFKAGNFWTENDLITKDYNPLTAPSNIPTPKEVAAALNELKASHSKADLSLAVAGAIAGINRVLNQSWGDASVQFPYPAMAGSGDRMNFYWAVYGEAPDLSKGIPPVTSFVCTPLNKDSHACQGLSYFNQGGNCAAPAAFHSCAGSNSCKAQSGCGFPKQLSGGGHSCGGSSGCGSKAQSPASAPNGNKCATYGGCAVPISASQLYPSSGTMEIVDVAGDGSSIAPGTISYNVGDSVYDTAWKAYSAVVKHHNAEPGSPPAPNALRTALPPST